MMIFLDQKRLTFLFIECPRYYITSTKNTAYSQAYEFVNYYINLCISI